MFEGLDEHQEYDPEVLSTLSNWANKVHVNIPKTIKAGHTQISKDDTIIVRNNKDADADCNIMAALPRDKNGLAKVMKKMAKVEVAPDEILCMVDSGSFVHAIDADVELPDHHIRENNPKGRSMVCETACGGILKKLGTVRINGEVDNEKVSIEFDHMRVRTPILSVRKLVRDDHEIYIKKGGGSIRHTTNGKQISFFEYAGVYYLKLKISPPTDSNGNNNGFGRREPELQSQPSA